jgi:hypothetical protein
MPIKQRVTRERMFRKLYGAGFDLICRMGYQVDRGLGKAEDGILEPVPQLFKNKFTGSLSPDSSD